MLIKKHRVAFSLLVMLLATTSIMQCSMSFATDKLPKLSMVDKDMFSYVFVNPLVYTSWSSGENLRNNSSFATNHVVKATPGEHEVLGLVLRTNGEKKYLSLTVNDFVSDTNKVILKEYVDLKVAARWYQASLKSVNPSSDGSRHLVHELLLNNENLISVDSKSQKNFLTVNSGSSIDISSPKQKIPETVVFNDSDKIQPVLINGTDKLIWINYQIPETATAGTYRSSIALRQEGSSEVIEIPLVLNVLPFSLKKPSHDFGLYYRARLSDSSQPFIGSDIKNAAQYLLELQNMKVHGVEYPTFYEQIKNGNSDKVIDALALRDQAGLGKDKIFVVGQITQKDKSYKYLASLKHATKKWKSILDEFGYETFYFYGKDEAKKGEMAKQLPAWDVVRKAGGKVFAACHIGAIDYVGSGLDLPVLAAKNNYKEVLRWNEIGIKPYVYSNPQVGIEDPELYRKNYGFRLWLSPYGGVMNYAYQHAFNDIWNDFDHERYRDHVFAYPTSNGVIDTVQWKGFREAVDDVRYADKLAELIGDNEAKLLIDRWVTEELTTYDVREKVIAAILSAQSIESSLSPPQSLQLKYSK